MSIDRRVARTRTALYDALVALILRKDYDDISLRDILAEANVGRSTFYAHFTSKDELLERSLERLRVELVEGHRHALTHRGDSSWSWSLAMFEHVAGYKRLYDVVVGKRAGTIVLKGQRDALTAFLKELRSLPQSEGVPRELMVGYIAATFLTVMTWWLDRRFSLSPREIDAIFRRLVAIPA